MKKQFSSISLIMFMLVIVLACSTDDTSPPDAVPGETRLVYHADQIPKIKSLLLDNIGIQKGSGIFSANTGNGINELSIDWEEILQLVDSAGNETYTFGIEDNDEDIGTFYNLILKVDALGSLQRPFLLKYSMTDEFLVEYLQTGSFENFSGSVQKILINGPGNSKGGYTYSSDPNTIDDLSTSPCGGEVDINGGSSGTSGGDLQDAEWKCEVFVQVTDWFQCLNDDCTELEYSHSTAEYSTECDLVVENGAVDLDEDCKPKDDVTPIKLPKKKLEELIDDSLLKPCMKKLVNDIKQLNKGMSWIIQKFSGNSSTFNWKMQDGSLPSNTNAQTPNNSYNRSTGTVTTTFDSQKFQNATDISIVRTMLHESIHAYLTAFFRSDPLGASQTYADLVRDHNNQVYSSLNDTQHADFVRNFVGEIALALEEFGTNMGYQISSQYYNDLAWGGLTHWKKRDSQGNVVTDNNGNPVFEETSWFKKAFPQSSDRSRVLNNVNIEAVNVGNGNQKGTNAGC